MNNFRDKLIRFMYGRYGADQLYKFLAVLWFVMFFLNIFIRSAILNVLGLALLVWIYSRVLSKNVEARRRENEFYLRHTEKIRGFFRIRGLMFRDRKTHCYKKCPACKKMLRLPRRKGTHTVCCPQCKKEFSVKI